jgi:hypothetical protein
MATPALSEKLVTSIPIEVDGKKLGRVKLAYSSSAAELRTTISDKFVLPSSTFFLDSKGYRVSMQDEKEETISELLNDNGIVQMETDAPIPIPERRQNVSRGEAGLNFTSLNLQASTASLQGPTIPGSMPTHSASSITLATHLSLDQWKEVLNNCNLLYGIRMDGEEPVRATRPLLQFKESSQGKPRFQVTDHSCIRAYMRSRKVLSSFVSSDYFDGSISLSCPLIGIGINKAYLKTNATTHEERVMYSTCIFDHSRVTLDLDSSDLEPTQEFVDAINSALQHVSARSSEVEKVLREYGHLYPRQVVLGGHLYHTEEHRVKGSADEHSKKIEAETRFNVARWKQVNIHADGGSANRSRSEWSEQDSSITFQAVGGNTLLCHDPTRWAQTVADPSNWRIIDQSHYQSVLTLLSEKQQTMISK